MNAPTVTAWRIWRHPRAVGAAGRCIGRTDLRCDPRRAKRLAHRIRKAARRDGALREVWTSPLARSASVGRWLRRWGWRHRIDPRVAELDFGAWDGARWSDIGAQPVAAWCADFAMHAPGGGESVDQLLRRCEAVLHELPVGASVVTHAGWINAARWVIGAKPPPHLAEEWPAPLGYAQRAVF